MPLHFFLCSSVCFSLLWWIIKYFSFQSVFLMWISKAACVCTTHGLSLVWVLCLSTLSHAALKCVCVKLCVCLWSRCDWSDLILVSEPWHWLKAFVGYWTRVYDLHFNLNSTTSCVIFFQVLRSVAWFESWIVLFMPTLQMHVIQGKHVLNCNITRLTNTSETKSNICILKQKTSQQCIMGKLCK